MNQGQFCSSLARLSLSLSSLQSGVPSQREVRRMHFLVPLAHGSRYVAEPAWLRDSQPRMATPLRLENFGRIDFSLGRRITRGKKTPKSMTPYVKVPGELVRIFFIHYCGRSDHFYMASLQIVLNKVYFSRYSWVGFVKN